ncbi:MAG: MmgE/PrpD family protein [Rhodospirillales bacterium]|nr:MmgE/PrpD family protein [Rhodospirillales bacterium]
MSLSRRIVRAWRDTAARPLPPEVLGAAKAHLLDAIGVGLAASASAAGLPYRRFAATLRGEGPASLFGAAHGVNPADAAMINGGLIHSLEYDDTHTGSIVHGSAVLAAAALAAAEAGAAGGAALLGAYVRGWEVLVRIGLAAPGAFQARGFQITSVGGALVAALIGADLAGLDEDGMVMALGIALSQGSGVFEFLSNGSSVKSLHPGWAAHAGLIAAHFAACGMTGPETALDGRFGLFASFAGDPGGPARLDALMADFGAQWHLPQAAFKFHPCCHYLHPFIEAAEALLARGLEPARLRCLTCRVPAGAAGIICEPWAEKSAPASAHAMRWSLPAVLAARLVDGPIGLASFERPLSPAARDFTARIAWEPMTDTAFPRVFEAELIATLDDAEPLRIRIADVYGNAGRPAPEDAVRAKFRANAGLALPGSAIAALEEAIAKLDRAASVTALGAALRQVSSKGGFA